MERTKLLFLPHCLNKYQKELIRKEAKDKGYDVHVVGGGSKLKKIVKKRLEQGQIYELIGIACEDEVTEGLEYTKPLAKKGTIIKSIILTKDGCEDTKLNLEEALQQLE